MYPGRLPRDKVFDECRTSNRLRTVRIFEFGQKGPLVTIFTRACRRQLRYPRPAIRLA